MPNERELTAFSASVTITDMIYKRDFCSTLWFILIVILTGPTLEVFAETEDKPQQKEVENSFYADRFIFRGDDIDDLLMIVIDFERGKNNLKYYGEFFGAIFEKNNWSLFEGNDKYRYLSTDLKVIQPSYFASVKGTAASGFILQYDAGDYIVKISSGPVDQIYTPDNGSTLKKKVGIAEAVVTIHGNEIWGDLVHESLIWDGFNGLKRYKNLYKEYHGFYLKSNKGKQLYFHQNKADHKALKKEYLFSETPLSEGGIFLHKKKIIHSFKPPIPITTLKEITPPFAFYSVPQRWQVLTSPDQGELFLWSRGEASQNWLFGGYYIMAIEGISKNGEKEERFWGFAEYFP